MSELRECPFCGHPGPHPFSSYQGKRRYVVCWNCRATGPHGSIERGKADERAAWNTRPADAVRDGVVIQNAVVQFLLGAAPIDGKWFGDLHPKHPGRLWWRRLLRAALAQDGRKS